MVIFHSFLCVSQGVAAIAGEFDAVTCLDGRLVVHDARMHPDMVKLLLGRCRSLQLKDGLHMC